MRFFNYINEEALKIGNDQIEIEDFVDILKKDCSFYIDNFLKNKIAFFKGTYNDDKVKLENLHSNRMPQGTPIKIYDYINAWLGKHGYNKRNDSLICTTSYKTAEEFGRASIIFPIGTFKYTFCKSEDFNLVNDKSKFNLLYVLYNMIKDNKLDMSENYFKLLVNDEFVDLNSFDGLPDDTKIYLNNSRFIFTYHDDRIFVTLGNLKKTKLSDLFSNNKNIKEALTNNYECWINPKSFYFIDDNFYDAKLKKYIE